MFTSHVGLQDHSRRQKAPKEGPGLSPDTLRKHCVFSVPPGPSPRSPQDLPGTPQGSPDTPQRRPGGSWVPLTTSQETSESHRTPPTTAREAQGPQGPKATLQRLFQTVLVLLFRSPLGPSRAHNARRNARRDQINSYIYTVSLAS